jgi:large subunit ribosomal protein L6
MSRVGKKPIPIPAATKVSYQPKERILTVQGEKGTLTREIHPDVGLKIEDRDVKVTAEKSGRDIQALRGLVRSLAANMIDGVSKGFERSLEINGIGYRAEVSGNTIVFNLGYSHPINFTVPEGISASVDKNILKLAGIDKEKLGHTAASIRRLRPPEPYKGKGIKYAEEHIQRKAGKTGAK